jgi:hypothetical protein
MLNSIDSINIYKNKNHNYHVYEMWCSRGKNYDAYNPSVVSVSKENYKEIQIIILIFNDPFIRKILNNSNNSSSQISSMETNI